MPCGRHWLSSEARSRAVGGAAARSEVITVRAPRSPKLYSTPCADGRGSKPRLRKSRSAAVRWAEVKRQPMHRQVRSKPWLARRSYRPRGVGPTRGRAATCGKGMEGVSPLAPGSAKWITHPFGQRELEADRQTG